VTTSGQRLEFWPDYRGVLLHEGGTAVPLDALPLPPEVIVRAAKWVDRYDDANLDLADGDSEWLAEGRALFGILRDSLALHGIIVVDWEGLWETPAET